MDERFVKNKEKYDDSSDSEAWGDFTPPPFEPIKGSGLKKMFLTACCPCKKTYFFRPESLELRSFVK